MKPFLIIIILFCVIFKVSKAQQTLENAADGVERKITSSIKSCKDIPKDSKIAVLFFESSDGFRTPLGVSLSKKIATRLSANFNKKDFDILFPENIEEKKIDKIAARYFTPPSTSEEENEFNKQFISSKRPDYFLMGKYYINPNCLEFTVTEVNIQKNTYTINEKKTSFGVNVTTVDILTGECEEIKRKNIPIEENINYFMQLISWAGNSSELFDFSLIELTTNNAINENAPLIIGKTYVLNVKVNSPCYIYAFMYCPEDKEHPFISPLFPYQEGKSKLFNPDKHKLPHSDGFSLTPPVGKTYFKIIAVASENIFVEMNSQKDKEGFIEPSMNSNNTEVFIKKINQKIQSGMQIDSKLKEFNVKY